MKYKAVIFDFNGTLFLDNDKHVKAWGKIAEEIRGTTISAEELRKNANGVPNKKIVEYLFGQVVEEDVNAKYSKLKEEYYREFCKADNKTFHLVKGSEDYFLKLKNHNIPFTIASASIKDNIDFFVESFNLDDWIKEEDIVYDDGTYVNKVQMFIDAANILGVDIRDTLIIEDSISGITNAYEAGCRNIVVLDSANMREEYEKLPGVIKVINDFTELM